MPKKCSHLKEQVIIDVNSISKADWDAACRVLNSSVRLVLAAPVKRADFEAWKAKKTTK